MNETERGLVFAEPRDFDTRRINKFNLWIVNRKVGGFHQYTGIILLKCIDSAAHVQFKGLFYVSVVTMERVAGLRDLERLKASAEKRLSYGHTISAKAIARNNGLLRM